jgi:DNA-binding transcriptional LysR family regulator
VTSPQIIHVNRREADLFLSFFKPQGQGLVSECIGSFDIHVYGSPRYLSLHGSPATVEAVRELDFVTYIDDLIQVDAVRWQRDILSDGVQIVFNSNSMIAQMNAAAGGLGLVVLPKFAVHGGEHLVPVLPELLKTSREIWLNVHHDLQFAPRIKTLVQFLKRQIKADMLLGHL